MQLYCLYLLELPILVELCIGYELREGKPFSGVECMLSMEGLSICGMGCTDLYDWIGAGICLVGVSVMLFAPRQ